MVNLFVPGRLCLFGEHSDWAGALRGADASIEPGACIVTGTDQGITATAEPSADFELVSRLPDGHTYGPIRVPMGDELQRLSATGDFFSYATGVAAEVDVRFRPGGVRISTVDSDLPIRRGLSSSAAICVLIARAFNQVYDLGLSVREEMELAYRGEIASGSQCGRMDQACAYGRRVVLLGFDGDGLEIEVLQPGASLFVLIVDLCRQKDTRRILSDLHSAFLGPIGVQRTRLRAALGCGNARVIAAARSALAAGDARALGVLMAEAQTMFDECVVPACPSELTAPRLHATLRHPALRDLSWGGKGVGSQGDGAAQFVCRGGSEREELARVFTAEGLHCLPLTIAAGSD